MAAIVHFTSLSISSLVFNILILSITLCLTKAQTSGFSVELIHRDSPRSPFYNPMETTSDRVTNAVRRSFARARRFGLTSVSTQELRYSNVTVSSGEYLMNISIGTPVFSIVGSADTGSDAVWTQCKPCTKCFEQEAPMFDPSQSSTYNLISCNASQCHHYEGGHGCSINNTCQYYLNYDYDYLDHFYTAGDVAFDTITFASTTGPPVSIANMVIACGHNNSGTGIFNEVSQRSGIIGLGAGRFSLISQMGSSIAGKFSYCLLPFTETNISSKMNFGSNAIVSGPGVVSTTLIMIEVSAFPTTYHLHLEAISVGDKRINYTAPIYGAGGKANIVLDSGTTMTFVPIDVLSEIESAVASHIPYPKVALVPPGRFGLCYDARTGFGIPDITMHFEGAEVRLYKENVFVLAAEKPMPIECLAFASYADLSIYGNVAQINYLVGYDIEKKTVSFKPTDCSL